MDAHWARTVALWEKIKQGYAKFRVYWHKFLLWLFLVLVVVGIPYLIWDLSRSAANRHAFDQSVWHSLKWYLISGIAGWVISKIWRKKPKPESPENDSGDEPSVQSSKPKSKRKNHRRVQRGR